jgi:flagellar basal body-associated protein FliL
MSEASSFQVQQPTYVEKSSNKKRLVVIFLVVLLLLIAGLGALYLLGSSAKHSPNPTNPIPTETAASPTPTSSTSAQLSATPSAALSPTPNLTSLTVSVLNGSGTPGAAGKVADALKNVGLTNVTTGNANAYTYTGITVYVKDKSNLPLVQNALHAATSPSTKVTASVDNTIPTDIEVIVGK